MKAVDTSSSKQKKQLVPIQLRFEPHEAAELRKLADAECRTAAAFLRLVALRGIVEYRRDPRTLNPNYQPAAE